MKSIKTDGIQFIELLAENSAWYCGTDYACGDLYEAEELFKEKGSNPPNRLIFIHHPDGTLYEPIKLTENQYFGRPAQIGGIIYILLVDFNTQQIRVLCYDNGLNILPPAVELPLSEVKDCYNLLLKGEPFMLTRQDAGDQFEVIWPEKLSFKIGSNESFVFRKDEEWVFSRWIEDPDYREEVVVRSANGEIIKTIPGNLFITPTGETWVLE